MNPSVIPETHIPYHAYFWSLSMTFKPTSPLSQQFNEALNQSVNHRLKQQFNQALNQPLNQLLNQPHNQQLSQALNQSLRPPLNHLLNRQLNQALNQAVNRPPKQLQELPNRLFSTTTSFLFQTMLLHNNYTPSYWKGQTTFGGDIYKQQERKSSQDSNECSANCRQKLRVGPESCCPRRAYDRGKPWNRRYGTATANVSVSTKAAGLLRTQFCWSCGICVFKSSRTTRSSLALEH